MPIKESELIINKDGSIFHLHLKPEDLGDYIILVGDPGRVETFSKRFGKLEKKVANREFITHIGRIGETRFTVLSTGIGTDNIDIVLNELDALANIDFETREIKSELRSLNILRVGTCGAMQKDIDVDSFLASEISAGFDGLLNYYAGRNGVCNTDMEKAFLSYTNWNRAHASPYFVKASDKLLNLFSDTEVKTGVNISAQGFYGPQGRVLRINLADMDMNEKIENFNFRNKKITHYEMESSAIYGLSALLGHNALTICLVIGNRVNQTFSVNYPAQMEKLVELVLEKLTASDER